MELFMGKVSSEHINGKAWKIMINFCMSFFFVPICKTHEIKTDGTQNWTLLYSTSDFRMHSSFSPLTRRKDGLQTCTTQNATGWKLAQLIFEFCFRKMITFTCTTSNQNTTEPAFPVFMNFNTLCLFHGCLCKCSFQHLSLGEKNNPCQCCA